jgi:hypothetical protein
MTISRRKFATILGAGAAGAALAPSFTSSGLLSRVRAQDEAPMRFLAVRSPHGVDRDYWIPRAPGGGEPGSADMSLMDLTFEGEDAILTPLTGWRERITVLDGLDTQVCKEGTRGDRRTFHGHNEQGCMLTGAQPPADRESANFDNHPSLDFYLHSELGAPYLITASVEGTGTWKCMSYDDRGLPRAPESNPQTVFDDAFAGFVPAMPGVDPNVADRIVLAQNLEALRRMRDRLSGAEYDRLQRHIDAIQRRIPGPGGFMPGACGITDPASARPTRGGGLSSYMDVEAVTRTHSQVIANAFACGVSRVATLQILNDYPNWYTDLPEVRTPEIVARYGSDTFRFHESLVHDYWGASGTDRVNLRRGFCAGLRWSATLFSSVLDELDAIPDPQDPRGGSVLDNTIVFWHNEFGHDGHDNQHTRHPAIIAGGGGRVLKLGRYLRLRNIESDERVPHNLLLTSIAQAMGLTDVDYFGDRDLRGRANYMGPLLPLMV